MSESKHTFFNIYYLYQQLHISALYEHKKTHFMFNNIFFLNLCHLIDIVKNMSEPDRPQIKI
jgi:hypothetical protein